MKRISIIVGLILLVTFSAIGFFKVPEIKKNIQCNTKNESVPYDKIMIIAHPDDELLFGYDILSKEDVFVLVFTLNYNNAREKEFEKVMEALGVKNYKILGNISVWENRRTWNEENASRIINEYLSLRCDWDMVITHNEFGDYGHPQHKELHKLVKNTYKGDNLYVFGDIFIKHPNFMINEDSRKIKDDIHKLYESQYNANMYSPWYSHSDRNYLIKLR